MISLLPDERSQRPQPPAAAAPAAGFGSVLAQARAVRPDRDAPVEEAGLLQVDMGALRICVPVDGRRKARRTRSGKSD